MVRKGRTSTYSYLDEARDFSYFSTRSQYVCTNLRVAKFLAFNKNLLRYTIYILVFFIIAKIHLFGSKERKIS